MIAIVFGGFLDKQGLSMTKYTIDLLCRIFDNDVIIIDFFKSNKLVNICGKNHKYVKVTFDDCEDYSDCYHKALSIIEEHKIKKIIWYRTMLSGQYNSSNYSLAKVLEKRISKKIFTYVNYQSTVAVHKRYIFMKAASRCCDIIIQFLIDINEFTFDKTIKFKGKFYKTYLAKVDDFILMPAFEAGLLMSKRSISEKIIDFVFWCTAKTDNRKYIADRKIELEKLGEKLGYDIKIICAGDKHGCISEDEYDKKLSKSKFTLCIPAYNKDHFSIWRIFEALAFDCVCLVLSNNKMKDLQVTFPDIYEVIKKYNLFVDDFNDIQKKIKELDPIRERILYDLKNTNSCKKISDFDWCRRRWRKMLEVN